jgi:hypothetical protein
MVLGAFASLRYFREKHLLYYSDWQDVQAVVGEITEVIVIALEPESSERKDFATKA